MTTTPRNTAAIALISPSTILLKSDRSALTVASAPVVHFDMLTSPLSTAIKKCSVSVPSVTSILRAPEVW